MHVAVTSSKTMNATQMITSEWWRRVFFTQGHDSDRPLVEMAKIMFSDLKYISATYIAKFAYCDADHKGQKQGSHHATSGITSVVNWGSAALQTIMTIAICILACQLIVHHLWTLGGVQIASALADIFAGAWLMCTLATFTTLTVPFDLFGGASK